MTNPIIYLGYGETSEGPELLDNDTFGLGDLSGTTNLGSFVQGIDVKFYVIIKNLTPSTILSIAAGSVVVSGDATHENSYNSNQTAGVFHRDATDIITLPFDIEYSTPVFLEIKITTETLGRKSSRLTILSNDETNPEYQHDFFFEVSEPSPESPDIAVFYQNNTIQQQSTVSIGKVAQDSVSTVSFTISNQAIQLLTIPEGGINVTSISGNETVVSNPSSSEDVDIEFGETVTLTVSLDTINLGNKSFVVVISSNDPDENPFVFTVYYEIAKQFDLVIQQSSVDIEDGQTVNLGSFNYKSVINKVITLGNNGIAYGIRVTNVISEGDVALVNLPTLPLVLQPNNGNYTQFIARFDSDSLGLRTASIKIQWEVSA